MGKAFCVIFIGCALALAACGGKVRQDFGGGGSDAPVMILRDPPAVELSIWEGAIVYDLRSYEQWTQGHISGARRVSIEDLKNGRALPEDLTAPLLFMGEGPLDLSPEQAADIALARGYSNVQIFPGGWRQWIGAQPVQD